MTARVIAVVGPTAVGKSDLAIELALQRDGEVVNADSMQLYRGMDIGTAKPDAVERARVPHHLIDILDPTERYSAARFAAEAERLADEIRGRGRIALLVGGMSIINTMAMSIAERTREIGVRRAIGASRRRIVRELMTEAGVIGTIGGLIGVGLGALVVVLANELGRSAGTVLFELTPSTVLFALAFSTILGVLAGIIPAWSAARLDPVTALRHE